MHKYIRIFLAGIIAAGLLSGCGEKGMEMVSLDGSTSMEKVIGYLREAYMEANDKVKITYNPTGSGAGIAAVLEGRSDIGLSTRTLTEEEAQMLSATIVAIDGIAMIINHENPVENLSVDQIKKLYTGESKNWRDVGGKDAPVVCIGREAASGTRDGFETVTDTKDRCLYTQELTSAGDVIQTVATNPNAIGYASIASVKDSVKILKVDGVLPTTQTIQNGEYEVCRDFLLVTKKEGLKKEAAKKFYNFCSSEGAGILVEKAGAVPVKRQGECNATR